MQRSQQQSVFYFLWEWAGRRAHDLAGNEEHPGDGGHEGDGGEDDRPARGLAGDGAVPVWDLWDPEVVWDPGGGEWGGRGSCVHPSSKKGGGGYSTWEGNLPGVRHGRRDRCDRTGGGMNIELKRVRG